MAPKQRAAPAVPQDSATLATRVLASLPGTSVIVFDRRLHVMLASGRALFDHGYDAAKMEGRELVDIIPAQAYERLAPVYARALEGETETFEYETADRRGWYRVTAGPIRDRSGRIVAALAISQDISERRRAEEDARRRDRLLVDVLNSTGSAISVKDVDGRYILVNEAYAEMVGIPADEFPRRTVDELFPDSFAARLAADDERVLDGEVVQEERDYPAGDGTSRTATVRLTSLCSPDGSVYGVCAAGIDVTEQKQTEAHLREATTLFETAFAHAPIGIALVALDGRFLKVNAALCELTGYSHDELTGLTFRDITHPDDLDEDLDYADKLVAGTIDRYTMEKRYFTKGGHLIWARLAGSLVRDADGRPSHLIAQIEDVSERKRMEARLRELADRDSLTDLLNRRRFEEELERQLSRCRRYGERAALLVFDIDSFKEVNDRFGHKAGDAVLRGVARLIRHRIRESDVAARFGGDEFAALLLNIAPEQAAALAEGIRQAVERAHLTPELDESVTVSIGVEVLDERTGGRDVFATADSALYRAKREGAQPRQLRARRTLTSA